MERARRARDGEDPRDPSLPLRMTAKTNKGKPNGKGVVAGRVSVFAHIAKCAVMGSPGDKWQVEEDRQVGR